MLGSAVSSRHLEEDRVEERKTIVIIGTTGSGKSTLGNVLLSPPGQEKHGDEFETGSGASSCTLDCKAIDGFWLGDLRRPVRIIDTPGHGDSKGRDEELRESMVRTLKEQEAVHAFILTKNSEQPRFDKQEVEHLKILKEMFGGGIARSMIIVLTRFHYSKSAEKIRTKNGITLNGILEGLWNAIQDYKREVPMIVVDAFYDEEKSMQRDKFLEGTQKVWDKIETFSRYPFEHLENVKDDVSKLKEELRKANTDKSKIQEELKEREAQLRRQLDEPKWMTFILLATAAAVVAPEIVAAGAVAAFGVHLIGLNNREGGGSILGTIADSLPFSHTGLGEIARRLVSSTVQAPHASGAIQGPDEHGVIIHDVE